jgi:hypothetical protein
MHLAERISPVRVKDDRIIQPHVSAPQATVSPHDHNAVGQDRVNVCAMSTSGQWSKITPVFAKVLIQTSQLQNSVHGRVEQPPLGGQGARTGAHLNFGYVHDLKSTS